MKLISHRGNIKGRVPEKENRPSYIDCAIQLGYDVEIDVRYENDMFQLGHDIGEFMVDLNWLKKRSDKLWLHCKDINSAQFLSKHTDLKYFCHTNDPYVIMSTGHLWVHDITLNVDQTCIIPLLSFEDMQKISLYENQVYAVCTDYIIR